MKWKAFPLLFLTLFITARLQAQISDSLYLLLPDSIKPADRMRMTGMEKGDIIGFSYFLQLDRFASELEVLALSLEHEAQQEKDKDQRILYVNALMCYYFNIDKTSASSFKYANALIKEVNDDELYSTQHALWKAKALRTKGDAYNSIGNYEKGIAALNDALLIYSREKDSTGVGVTYILLATGYFRLGLSKEAIACYDRALPYLTNNYYVTVVTCDKANTYLDLYEKTGDAAYTALSEKLLLGQIATRNEEGKHWIAYCYVLLARKAYLDKNYTRAIGFADSALIEKYLTADYEPEATRYMSTIYRGISLLHTPQKKQGVALLTRLLQEKENHVYKNYNLVAHYTRELYTAFKQEGNWKEALVYYEQYTAAQDSQKVMANRGKTFEVNQKYAVAQKETEIQSLENKNIVKEKQRTQAVAAVVITLLALLVSLLIFYMLLRRLQQKRKKAELATAAERKAKEELELLGNVQAQMVRQETIIEQRKEISVDMHDMLGSSLAALKFYIADLKTNAITEEALDLLAQVETEAGYVYTQSRQYMHSLNSQAQQLQQEYNDLLYNIFQRLSMNDSILQFELDFDHEQVRGVLRPEQYNHLIQMTSELITNVRKHAHATVIQVRVHCTKDTCTLTVADNGTGFDTESKKGMGLQSIRDRVAALNGTLRMASGKEGTTITIEFPVLYTIL